MFLLSKLFTVKIINFREDNLELNSSQVTVTAWLTEWRPEVVIKVQIAAGADGG